MLKFQRSFKYYVDLVFQQSKAALRVEASRGYLGVLWWIIEPIMYMLIFYMAFAHFFHRGNVDYIMELLIGLVSWKWFVSTVVMGSNSLMANANLMNQVYLPKIIFPITTVVVNTFKFLIILILLLLFLQFSSKTISWTWAILPVIISLQLMLIMSLTCLFSAVMPFFPDFRIILENIMLMFFFISGVFVDISTLPLKLQKYLYLNPMATLISMYRKILLHKELPNSQGLVFIFIFSLILFSLSLVLFYKYDRIYPKISVR